MRTITKKFAQRLLAQAKEAELQGLTKVADHVSNMVTVNSVRQNDVPYVYASNEFQSDIESKLWEGVIRAADFFDCDIKTAEMHNVVTKLAQYLIEEVRINGGVKHGVGAHEPSVPGERR